jgi:hypothetical protein
VLAALAVLVALAMPAFRLLALGVVGAARAPFEQPFEQPAPEASSQVAAKNAVLGEDMRAADDTPSSQRGAMCVQVAPLVGLGLVGCTLVRLG